MMRFIGERLDVRRACVAPHHGCPGQGPGMTAERLTMNTSRCASPAAAIAADVEVAEEATRSRFSRANVGFTFQTADESKKPKLRRPCSREARGAPAFP